MLEKLHGLVLRTTRFNDTQQVVDVFTREHGRQQFVVTFSNRRHAGAGAVWRPLNFVEMEADIRSNQRNRLPHPHDVRTYITYTDLPFNSVKTAMALFLAEFLQNVLKAAQGEQNLFDFLEKALQWFDTAMSGYANFHICILLHLMHFVGIQPDCETRGDFFDLRAGSFTSNLPRHQDFLSGTEAETVRPLLRMNFANMRHFHLDRSQRRRIVEIIHQYYRLHLPPFAELRSPEVLKAVFE